MDRCLIVTITEQAI